MFSQAAIIRHYYIRALVESKRINTIWISEKENPADMFTKPLLHQPLRAFTDSMTPLRESRDSRIEVLKSGGVLNKGCL
jgi:hypothetical protein